MEVEENFNDENGESLEQCLKNNYGDSFSNLWLELNKLMQSAVGCDDGNSPCFSME